MIFKSFFFFFCDNIKSSNIKDYLFGLPYHTSPLEQVLELDEKMIQKIIEND
jgi:hypothetical protein